MALKAGNHSSLVPPRALGKIWFWSRITSPLSHHTQCACSHTSGFLHLLIMNEILSAEFQEKSKREASEDRGPFQKGPLGRCFPRAARQLARCAAPAFFWCGCLNMAFVLGDNNGEAPDEDKSPPRGQTCDDRLQKDLEKRQARLSVGCPEAS